MPHHHCPHCGQTIDVADAPPIMAYATPEPGQRREAKWLAVARISTRAAGIVVALFALAFAYKTIHMIPFAAAPMPANIATQMQQSQQLIQSSQKQQVQAQQQLKKSIENSGRSMCSTNILQIWQTLGHYAKDHDGVYPPALEDLPRHHYITRDVLVCPAKDQAASFANAMSPATTPAQSQTDLYIYVPNLPNVSGADTIVLYEPLTNRDGDGVNVLYHNGHVAFLDKTSALAVTAELQAGFNPPRLGHY
jgi:hypothetical protein